jgi:hypothetical protein
MYYCVHDVGKICTAVSFLERAVQQSTNAIESYLKSSKIYQDGGKWNMVASFVLNY